MTWVSDGQEVLFIAERRDEGAYIALKVLKGIVICAAGDKARVANKEHRIDMWVEVDDLSPVKEDRNGRKESVAEQQGVLHPVEP